MDNITMDLVFLKYEWEYSSIILRFNTFSLYGPNGPF